MDYKSPDSSVHGILQARILEWVAISFSWGSSQTRDRTWVSRTAGGFFTIQALGCPLHQLNTNSSPHSPQSSIPSFFFLFLWVWVFYIFHMNGTVQYLSFCNWLISLSIIPSRFFQVTSCDNMSLCSWLNSIPFHIHRIWHTYITSLSMYQWRAFGLPLPFASITVMDTVCTAVFRSCFNLGCIPRSELTGWMVDYW